jgi:flagellar biosynthesis/type III secretory pathway protein FliH
LKTAIIVVHQLPTTTETLWLRLLGKGKVQQKAITELSKLPENNPLKSVILEVLFTLQKNLEINLAIKEPEDRELIMRLAPLYQQDREKAIQEGFQRGIAQGELELTIRLLTRKLGNLSPQLISRINQLSLESTQTLAEALLDFNNQQDLETWLQENS